ncbi:MAG: hypothetical protein KBO60_23770, partial [Achromobacter sp.]|nr:hypothetical protein [Achromobacter sp.]
RKTPKRNPRAADAARGFLLVGLTIYWCICSRQQGGPLTKTHDSPNVDALGGRLQLSDAAPV